MADDRNQSARPDGAPWINPQAGQRWVRSVQIAGDQARAVMAASVENYGRMAERAKGIEDVIASVMRSNLQAGNEILRLADPIAVLAIQQRFARACFDAMLASVEAFRVPVEEPAPVEPPDSPAGRTVDGRPAASPT